MVPPLLLLLFFICFPSKVCLYYGRIGNLELAQSRNNFRIQSQYKEPTASSYSDYCSVVGCPNSAYVLKKLGSICQCPLFPIPKNAELAKKWSDFAQLNIIYSSKRGQICSLHFIDDEPTDENPLPTIYPDFEHKFPVRKTCTF